MRTASELCFLCIYFFALGVRKLEDPAAFVRRRCFCLRSASSVLVFLFPFSRGLERKLSGVRFAQAVGSRIS